MKNTTAIIKNFYKYREDFIMKNYDDYTYTRIIYNIIYTAIWYYIIKNGSIFASKSSKSGNIFASTLLKIGNITVSKSSKSGNIFASIYMQFYSYGKVCFCLTKFKILQTKTLASPLESF